MVGIISLWLKSISSFITLLIRSSCECLDLPGGTGLRSMNKSGRTIPTVLCRSRGSAPSQNRACCFCKSGFSSKWRHAAQLLRIISPSETDGGTMASGCAVLGVLAPAQRCPGLCPPEQSPQPSFLWWPAGESCASSGLPGRTQFSGYAQASIAVYIVWSSCLPFVVLSAQSVLARSRVQD